MASSGKKGKQSKSKFAKKLVGYAAAAGATLAMGAPAVDATIVDPPDIVLQGPFAYALIDMNDDSKYDFFIGMGTNGASYSQGTQARIGVAPYTTGNYVAGEYLKYFTVSGASSSYPYARNFGPGQFISSALFSTTAYYVGYAGPNYGTASGGPGGNFVGKRGFLGVTFLDGSLTDRYYGWIDISVKSNLHELTIHRWGYEDVAGVRSQTPVPEPGSLALLAMGAAGLVVWRRGKSRNKSGKAS